MARVRSAWAAPERGERRGQRAREERAWASDCRASPEARLPRDQLHGAHGRGSDSLPGVGPPRVGGGGAAAADWCCGGGGGAPRLGAAAACEEEDDREECPAASQPPRRRETGDAANVSQGTRMRFAVMSRGGMVVVTRGIGLGRAGSGARRCPYRWRGR